MIFFFDSFRLEVADIAVTIVCPGTVATDIARNTLTGDSSKFGGPDPKIDNGMTVSRCASSSPPFSTVSMRPGRGAAHLTLGYDAVSFNFKDLTMSYADRLCSRFRAVRRKAFNGEHRKERESNTSHSRA
jgi:hypothetical protein